MLNFDKLYNKIINEDISNENVDNIENDKKLESKSFDKVEFLKTDPIDVRIKKIKMFLPTLSEEDIKKVVKNDDIYTTWVADFIKVFNKVSKEDLLKNISDEFDDDVDVDSDDKKYKVSYNNIKDIERGLKDYKKQKKFEEEDAESFLEFGRDKD